MALKIRISNTAIDRITKLRKMLYAIQYTNFDYVLAAPYCSSRHEQELNIKVEEKYCLQSWNS
jgi:hypothetical protein